MLWVWVLIDEVGFVDGRGHVTRGWACTGFVGGLVGAGGPRDRDPLALVVVGLMVGFGGLRLLKRPGDVDPWALCFWVWFVWKGGVCRRRRKGS